MLARPPSSSASSAHSSRALSARGSPRRCRERVALSIVLLFAALSGANTLGGGYLGGLTPPGAPAPSTTPVDPNTAIAIRNAAVGSILGMLIGLMGAVVGGWFASGEPMNVNHYRTRSTGFGRTAVASDRTTRM